MPLSLVLSYRGKGKLCHRMNKWCSRRVKLIRKTFACQIKIMYLFSFHFLADKYSLWTTFLPTCFTCTQSCYWNDDNWALQVKIKSGNNESLSLILLLQSRTCLILIARIEITQMNPIFPFSDGREEYLHICQLIIAQSKFSNIRIWSILPKGGRKKSRFSKRKKTSIQ